MVGSATKEPESRNRIQVTDCQAHRLPHDVDKVFASARRRTQWGLPRVKPRRMPVFGP